MPYCPPKQLQALPIWSLVIKNSRQEKVSEYNWTKKKVPLLTWPELQERYRSHSSKYAKTVGIVTDKVLTIDVDYSMLLPEYLQSLVTDFPTHFHKSKSGNGWKIYYFIDKALPKKWIKHSSGELFSNMFVTTTDPLLSDFSNEHVSSITLKQMAKYIPQISKYLDKHLESERKQALAPSGQNRPLDFSAIKEELQTILNTVPVEVDNMLQVAYETRLQDSEVNNYTHWLLVSHILADLSIKLELDYPNAESSLFDLFHNWSERGANYKSKDDCLERFERSINETREFESPLSSKVTIQTLRKLYWAYHIPTSDFPVVSLTGKGQKIVDVTDPENFEFLTKKLKLQMCQDYSTGDIFIQGPQSLIDMYFKDNQFYYLLQNKTNLSIPFNPRYRGDENLVFRLVKVFRRFGIKGVLRGHPLFAGFHRQGVQPVDILYEWVTSLPWDGKERALSLIEQSLVIDHSKRPRDVPKDFYHRLVFKHLIETIGLRAKAYRVMTNQQKPLDRFKKTQGILILAGYQNTRKSTWIECLLPVQAGRISNVTPSGVKDSLEIQRALSGTFILNIDEIDAVLDNINLSDFKNVITQDRDSFRTMYTQKFEDHPRAAGLFGTTNKRQLRLDRTGNRRFWIIPVSACNASPLNKCPIQQFWAELLYYAERLGVEDWNLTGQEKDLINATAQVYTKQTLSAKTLEMAFTNQEGDNQLYSSLEVNFDKLFSQMKQVVQRAFCKEKVFFATAGNKCFIYLQNKFLMDENIEFKLSSFNYEIGDFLDNLLGFQNVTKTYDKMWYRDGIVYFRTGKANPTAYHFIPVKEKIDKFVKQGLLTKDIYRPSYEEALEKYSEEDTPINDSDYDFYAGSYDF